VATIAVIDIGSNSVRLMVMTNGKTLYKRINTTRLGEGICSSDKLLSAAILRTAKAVAAFYSEAKEVGAESVCAFATAAVRGAKNADEFVSAVKELCPINIDVITGDEEALIGLTGALGLGDGGILDVGGGSSELTFRSGGKITYSRSLNIGAVRLYDSCGRNFSALSSEVELAVTGYGTAKVCYPLCAIGGTATSMAAVKKRLKEYSPKEVEGTEITLLDAEAMAEELLKMSVEDILNEYCLPLKRAEIIGGGALLVSKIMRYIGAKKIIVSERDNLEGYAIAKGLI